MKIIIMGCGGTGSNLIKELGRYLAGNEDTSTKVILVDGDVVEEKNLKRQSFQTEDCNKNKAEVMADIMNSVFDLEFSYYPKYVTEDKELENLIDDDVILVGCVDNHQCRQVMHRVFEKTDNIIYIDSANEMYSGEVVVASKIDGTVMYPDRMHYFPEILEEKYQSVEEMSCEELNNQTPQHIGTNMMAANICLMQVINGLTREYNGGGIYYFDAACCSIIKKKPD